MMHAGPGTWRMRDYEVRIPHGLGKVPTYCEVHEPLGTDRASFLLRADRNYIVVMIEGCLPWSRWFTFEWLATDSPP